MVEHTCTVDGCDRNARARGWCAKHYRRWKTRGDAAAPPVSTTDRFWSKVDTSGDCWEWTASLGPTGYGQFNAGGNKIVKSHRYAYELEHGPIPDGLVIDHMCHNIICVNPRHLRLATRKENQENRFPAHCMRGVSLNTRRTKWRARVGHNGKEYVAGYFDDPTAAAEAARRLRNELFTHNDADRKF